LDPSDHLLATRRRFDLAGRLRHGSQVETDLAVLLRTASYIDLRSVGTDKNDEALGLKNRISMQIAG
jgi:hypothetical protein